MTDQAYVRRHLLSNKIALVTGGGTGIGLAIAREYVGLGAQIIVTGRREDVLAQACRELGDSARYRVSDVTNKGEHVDLVADIENSLGPIDILVNNAGRNLKKAALEVTDQEFEEILELNLTSLFSMTRTCLRGMIERGAGSVINISSMSALYGLPGVAAYSASKTGLLGLTRTLASEVSKHGVRVNAIAPGFIDSAMMRSALAGDPARKDRILQRTPMGRFGVPEEVAAAAAFLAADASSFVTGICLPVDGGNSIGF